MRHVAARGVDTIVVALGGNGPRRRGSIVRGWHGMGTAHPGKDQQRQGRNNSKQSFHTRTTSIKRLNSRVQDANRPTFQRATPRWEHGPGD